MNTEATADVASSEPVAAPTIKLFTVGQIVLATVFGSPAAGGILAFVNHRRLGQTGYAWLALLLGVALTGGAIGLAFAVPDLPNLAIPALSLAALIGWCHLTMGKQLQAHLEAGGGKPSTLLAFGIGIAFCLLIIAAIVGLDYGGFLGYVDVDPTTRIVKGGEVWSYEDIGEEQLDQIGQILAADGWFDGTEKSVGVGTGDETADYQVSIILPADTDFSAFPDERAAAVARRVSAEVVDGATVEVRIYDNKRDSIRRVPMSGEGELLR